MGIKIDDQKCVENVREKLLEIIDSDFKEKFDKSKRKHVRFSSCSNGSFFGVKCPSCKNLFGISEQFFHQAAHACFHYTCPYCGYQNSLENN